MGRGGRPRAAGVTREPNGRASRAETRQGLSLQRRTQDTRAEKFGLTTAQAGSPHAHSIEGRLYLRGIITASELEAAGLYKHTLRRFARDVGAPTLTGGVLGSMQGGSAAMPPRPSGASGVLAQRAYDGAEAAIASAGREAVLAASCVLRMGRELPAGYAPALVRALGALVGYYGLLRDREEDAAQTT
jgi:hypothetical protein